MPTCRRNGFPDRRHNPGRRLKGQQGSGGSAAEKEVGGELPLLKMVGTQRIAEESWIYIDSRF